MVKARLGDLVKIRTGKLDANVASENGRYPFFTCAIQPLRINSYSYDCECVLVAGNGDLNVKYYNGKFDAYQRTYIIESNDHDILKCKYLYLFMNFYIDKLRKDSIGGVIKYIKLGNLTEAVLELPDIKRQQELIEKFDLLTTLIVLRKQQLSKLDQLVKSRFIEMFGDPVENPHHWTISRLEHSIKFITSGSRGWSQYFSNDGEFFITIKNVKNSKIIFNEVQYIHPPKNAEAARTKVQEDDLLISITADLGRTGVVTKFIAEKGAYINQHLTCIRLDKSRLLPLFVSYFLESPAGKKQFSQKNQTGVKAGLNFDAIKSLQIFTPPLSLQEQFIAFVQQVDKAKSSVKQSLEKLETLKKSLMQEYFG